MKRKNVTNKQVVTDLNMDIRKEVSYV